MIVRDAPTPKPTRTADSSQPARSSPSPSTPKNTLRPQQVDGMDRRPRAIAPVSLNPTPRTVAPAAPSTVPAAGLKRGDYGPNVKALQDALVKGGHLTAEQVATGPGMYGPRTETAVKDLQSKNGLTPTGKYDDATAAALAKELTPKPSDGSLPAAGLKRGATGPEVAKLQDALVKTGDLTKEQAATGPGVYGPNTERAVRAIQARNGLPVTGSYDAATQAAVGKEVEQFNDPGKLVDANYQRLLGRAPTADERSAAVSQANAIKDAGGSLKAMRQDNTSTVRQTPEYQAAHPYGAGAVNSTEDADRYFTTQWGPTASNSSPASTYGYSDCGPTSGVMALSELGLIEHPDAEGASAAIDGVRDAALGKDSTKSERMGFGTLAKGLEAYGAETTMLKGGTGAIDDAIERGNPVILGGNPWQAWGKDERANGNYLNSKDPGGHFIAVLGKTNDGKYIVGDPLVKGGSLAVTEAQLKTFLGQGFGAMEVSKP